MTEHELELAALAAHVAGEPWSEFWQQHGNQVRKAEPFNRDRFHKLVRRLGHLVTTGDPSNQYPPQMQMPWECGGHHVQQTVEGV